MILETVHQLSEFGDLNYQLTQMRVLSVNVSEPIAASYKGKTVATGIYKKPVYGPVSIRKTNIDGDRQADQDNHGGIDKAVYMFPSEHHAYYRTALGRDGFQFGHFGENLTTEGLLESSVRIGDRFLIGTAILEVSQPRSPCFKLAMTLAAPDVVKVMLESGKTGFYLRVVREGVIEPCEVSPESVDEYAPSVEDIHKLMFFDIMDVDGLQRAISTPALGRELRAEFSLRLGKLTKQPNQ